MDLDLAPLAQAIAQLDSGLARARAAPADELLRDGVIQRFEYTYELAHRTLRRFLVETEASPEVGLASFQELVRLGAERGLLANGWDIWRGYRAARAPAFLTDARQLLETMRGRSAT